LAAFRSEVGERLRVIELRLERLDVPTLPKWTAEQRESLLKGIADGVSLAKHSQVKAPVLTGEVSLTCAGPQPLNIQYHKL